MSQESQAQEVPCGLQTLPIELFRPIVDLITDQQSICALLFVSPFNYEAERAIYRKIAPRSIKNQKELFRRLQKCARVAKLVIELDLDIRNLTSLGGSYWSSLSLALNALVNLKTFDIHVRPGDSRVVHILDGCLFQLEVFSWPFQLDEKLLQFLENQPRIRILAIRSPYFVNPLPPTALPQLSIMTGNTSAINSLLPGRRITRLCWEPHLFDEPDLAHIQPALNNIWVLKFWTFAPTLSTIINCLGKLEVLEWCQKDRRELIRNAPFFSQLQRIIFCDMELFNPQEAITMLSIIPSLRLVDVALKNGKSFRWSRGSDIPQPIILHFDDWMLC